MSRYTSNGGDIEGRLIEEEMMEGRVYRANMALVAFNSLHLWGVRQSCSCSQILFVLNLYMGGE